jgi:hypothetical protein
VSTGRGWWIGGACLAVLSLGMPWDGLLIGAAHPARAAVVGALVLAAAGLRTGRERLLTAALGTATVGVLLGGLAPSPGRLALAGAVACLVLGCRASDHRLLPGGPVRNRAR